ncbi:MAG TPA: chorismate-binding protein, partial [Acidimicrobiales bacterium]|nr:chorismate-binding protein [Acidimicrobiales bacterium]
MTALPANARVGAPSSLGSCTVEVPAELCPDLVDLGAGEGLLWRSPSLSLLGIGSAARLDLGGQWAATPNQEIVARRLGSIGQHPGNDPGTLPPAAGAVALGALPYDPGRSGHLVVPRVLVVRAEGLCWVTLAGEPEWAREQARQLRHSPRQALTRLFSTLTEGRQHGPAPDGFELSTTMAHGDWLRLVERAVAEIENGLFEKVVLARRVDVRTNRPLAVREVLARMVALYPSCTIFQMDGFLGASPEVLVSRCGLEVSSHPLAGTVAR